MTFTSTCLRAALSLAASALLAHHAAAAPVIQYTTVGNAQVASGIDNLLINGANYDVGFVAGSYNSVFTNTQPTFLGNQLGASAAVEAIKTLFNQQTPRPSLSTDPLSGAIFAVFDDNFVIGGTKYYLAEQIGPGSLDWVHYLSFFDSLTVDRSASNYRFATFTPDFLPVATDPTPIVVPTLGNGLGTEPANAVPEPASLALVALALAGVGASRRRARKV